MDCSNANNALKPFAHLARDTGAIFSFFLCSSQECALLSLRAFLISSFHPIQHKANIITYRWARKNVSWHENERGKANLPWKICWLVGYKTCIMVWPAYYCSANRDTNCGQCKQKSLFTDEALLKKTSIDGVDCGVGLQGTIILTCCWNEGGKNSFVQQFARLLFSEYGG